MDLISDKKMQELSFMISRVIFPWIIWFVVGSHLFSLIGCFSVFINKRGGAMCKERVRANLKEHYWNWEHPVTRSILLAMEYRFEFYIITDIWYGSTCTHFFNVYKLTTYHIIYISSKSIRQLNYIHTGIFSYLCTLTPIYGLYSLKGIIDSFKCIIDRLKCIIDSWSV